MRKFLEKIYVIQTVSNELRKVQGLPYLGRGHFNAHRLNPWNPLSYLAVVTVLIVGVLMFGVVGFWKEFDSGNPFKWN